MPPRGNQEVLLNSESEEELTSAESEEGSEDGQAATQVEGADGFQAAAPVQDDLEQLIDPESVSIDQVKDYVQSELEAVPVMYLRWDTQQKWGQIRVLNPQLVEYYIKVIEKEPPRQPVRVLVRNMGTGMKFYAETSYFFFCLQIPDLQYLAVNISVLLSELYM